jgi:Fuc2NAc and GlcNAc transferase
VIPGIAFAITWVVTRTLIPYLRRSGVVDQPNARSSHAVATPRGGGLGILIGVVAGLIAGYCLGWGLPGPGVVCGAALVAVVGFWDDRTGGLPARTRLVLQIAAASAVLLDAGGLTRFPLPPPLDLSLGVLGAPVALIWIVGVTNLYNFLDGIDGFAGFQGVVAGLGIALMASDGVLIAIGLAIAGACGAFLLYNWRPARIFMGDVGSWTLGFLLAAMPFTGEVAHRGENIFVVAMCLWFFLSDGAFTLVARLLRGEKLWEPHCSHLYQRLVRTGLGHDAVVRVVGAAAVWLAALAVLAARAENAGAQWAVLGLSLAAFLTYCQWVRQRERRAHGHPGSTQTAPAWRPLS